MSALDAGLRPAGYPEALLSGNIANLRLFVYGKPVPKGRPRSRIATRGASSFVQVFTPEATVTWEEVIGWQVRQQLVELSLAATDGDTLALPMRGRVLVSVRFNFERPASLKKSIRYPVKNRTDVDNLVKSVLDALQNVGVFADDNQVTDCTISKRFVEPGHPQGVEMDITGWAQ